MAIERVSGMEDSAWTSFPYAVKKTAEDGTSVSRDNFVSFQIRGLSNVPALGFCKSPGISFDIVWTADDVDAVLFQGGRLWVVAKASHVQGDSGEDRGRPSKWAYRCNEDCDEAVSAAWRAFCIPVATAFSRYWDEKRAAAGRREAAPSSEGYSSLSAGRLYRSRVTQACSVLTAALARVGAPLTAEMMPPTASPSLESPDATAHVALAPEDAETGVEGEGKGEGAAQEHKQAAHDGKEEEGGPGEALQAVEDSSPGGETGEAHKKRSHRARKRTIREARHRDAGRLAMLVTLAATVESADLVAAMKELQVSGEIDQDSIQLASAALSGELQASAPGEVAHGAHGRGGEGSSLAKLLTSVAQSSKPSYRLGVPSAVSSRLSSAPSSGRRGGGDSRSYWGTTPGTMGMGMGAAGEYTPQGRRGPGRFTDDQRSTNDYRPRQTPPAPPYYPYQQVGGGGMGGGSTADSWEARSSVSGGLHTTPRPYAIMSSGSPQHMQQQAMHVMGPSPHYVSGPVLLQHPPTGMHPYAAVQPVHQAAPAMMVQAAGGGLTYIHGSYGGSAGVPVSLGPAMGGYLPTMTVYAIPMQNMGMGMGMGGMSMGMAGMGGQVMLPQPMQYMMPVGTTMRMGMAGEQGAQGSQVPQATLLPHTSADGQAMPRNM